MKDALGYYEILNVATDADDEAIKRSYRELAKIWHPDYNQGKDTTDMFQKISVANEILSDKQSRQIYDVLSLVYTQENYPDIDAMIPFEDDGDGTNLKALNMNEVSAWLLGYKVRNKIRVSSYSGAIRQCAKVAIINWIAGWWHYKAFIKNIQALINNFNSPYSSNETLRILLHNMIAYTRKGQFAFAYKCGYQALELADNDQRQYINNFLSELNIKASLPKPWNILNLKLIQLIMPMILFLIILLPTGGKYLNLTEAELWGIFSKKKEIDYYQTVNFGGGRGQSVDDVVVGKIMSIPIDKSDNSKLYHLVKESPVMYGPSSGFDIIKVLPEKTTIRLTGLTPDNVWARIMIDNGETGFVYYQDIKQGIGKEVPYGSSIIE